MNTPMQPRTIKSPKLRQQQCLEREYSLARGIFAGSAAGGRSLGTVGQLPSGPGAAQNAVTAEPKEAAPTDPEGVVGVWGPNCPHTDATPCTDVQQPRMLMRADVKMGDYQITKNSYRRKRTLQRGSWPS